MASISLLIPAWNESETISITTLENYEYLTELKKKNLISDFEIIALNDGSDDRTLEILQKLAAKILPLKIISNEKPTGIYHAFNLLYESANMEWVLLVPGDYQWRVEATKVLCETFIVSGSQNAISGIRINKDSIYSKARLLVSGLLGRFADWILKTENSDPGSIKLLPNSAMGKAYLSKSVLIEIERLYVAKTITNNAVLQVAVPWHPRTSGVASGVSRKTLQPILRDLCILSLNKLRGNYSIETLPVA